ncbi:LON peptidase N-terminal domain and RING finger protein 3, partial [Cucurbita argyrosperma subsp. sororia]
MGYQIVVMNLIAPFVLSFFMNPSQLPVGILFAVLAYFSLWIVVINVRCAEQFFLSVQEHAQSVGFYQCYAEQHYTEELSRGKFPLHIFEPRYRLMVRRVMEGNHRMGMVIVDSTTGSIADFACEVEITECEPLADGRFYLEIESRRRFRIIRSWDQDGYRVAEIEWVNDVAPAEGTREQAELQEMTNNAAEYAQSWIRKAKEASRRDHSKHDRLLNVEAMMPSSRDPERFSFWLATLSNRRPLERLELLRMTDTRERIRRGLVYLKAEEQGCQMQ